MNVLLIYLALVGVFAGGLGAIMGDDWLSAALDAMSAFLAATGMMIVLHSGGFF